MKRILTAFAAVALIAAASAASAHDYAPTGEAGRWIAEAQGAVHDHLVPAGTPAEGAAVSFNVSAEGDPQAVRIDHSSGSEAFDRAAVAAVRRTHFRSAPPTILLASRITVRLSAVGATQAAAH